MNTDTGELREMTEATVRQLQRKGEPWVPVTKAQVARLTPLDPAKRPAALRKWEARKERLHTRALARSKRNTKP